MWNPSLTFYGALQFLPLSSCFQKFFDSWHCLTPRPCLQFDIPTKFACGISFLQGWLFPRFILFAFFFFNQLSLSSYTTSSGWFFIVVAQHFERDQTCTAVLQSWLLHHFAARFIAISGLSTKEVIDGSSTRGIKLAFVTSARVHLERQSAAIYDHLVFFIFVYRLLSQNLIKPIFFLFNRSHNCTSLTISFVRPSFWLKQRFWLMKPASLNLLSVLLKQARTKQLILLYYTIGSASQFQEWLRFYSIVSHVRHAATDHAIRYWCLADESHWASCGCSETILTPAVVPMRLKPTFRCSQHEVATRRTVNAHTPRDHYVQSFFLYSSFCWLELVPAAVCT